jgi:uncharacterized protein (TIGR00369 family)
MNENKRYGVVSIEDRNSLTGMEFVRGFVDGTLPLNSMAATLNYDIVEAALGRVVISGMPRDTFLNPEGGVHGGFAATLLDSCMGLSIRSMVEKGYGSTTLELKISMVRPVTQSAGLVRAEGTVLSCGRRVGFSEGKLFDYQGKLLAHGTTTCLIFERT